MLASSWQKYGAIVTHKVPVSARVCHGVSLAVASVLNGAAVGDWRLVYVFESGHSSSPEKITTITSPTMVITTRTSKKYSNIIIPPAPRKAHVV
jgi:hypothetical protein